MASSSIRQQAVVKLEVTLNQCRANASVASPECEQQVLAAVLNNTLQTEEAQQQLRAAGAVAVETHSSAERQQA